MPAEDGGFLGWKNWKYPITFFHNRETTQASDTGAYRQSGGPDYVAGQERNPVVHPDNSIAYDLMIRYTTPKIKSFVSDIFAPHQTAQRGTVCQDFELRAMECIEYFGMKQSLDVCKDYYDDFMECTLKKKQSLRIAHMMRKRHRDNYIEYLQGKRSYESLYEPPPKMHAFIAPWIEEKYQGAPSPNI